jgi:hypothetical protein
MARHRHRFLDDYGASRGGLRIHTLLLFFESGYSCFCDCTRRSASSRNFHRIRTTCPAFSLSEFCRPALAATREALPTFSFPASYLTKNNVKKVATTSPVCCRCRSSCPAQCRYASWGEGTKVLKLSGSSPDGLFNAPRSEVVVVPCVLVSTFDSR